ncbi:MAG: adenylyltransferase/cytidyltransferase family protein, partial [Candidatus Spechtbacteria bacterium]|nr:adenylyltransferase/cytidyltransferase family protein [Candidatus Spechtbacteria bacterium]
TDLEESLLFAYFTERYCNIRDDILGEHPFRVALYGGTFDPAALHHRRIVEELRQQFDKVFVIPCGPRQDVENKPSFGQVSDEDRREMARMNFDISGVALDFYDLDNHVFTPTYLVQERYEMLYPYAEIWHVAGADLVHGGRDNNSEIQRTWMRGKEIWNTLNFAVIVRDGYEFSAEDLPPHCTIIKPQYISGSSTMIREGIRHGDDVTHLLTKDVHRYIEARRLYKNSKEA